MNKILVPDVQDTNITRKINAEKLFNLLYGMYDYNLKINNGPRIKCCLNTFGNRIIIQAETDSDHNKILLSTKYFKHYQMKNFMLLLNTLKGLKIDLHFYSDVIIDLAQKKALDHFMIISQKPYSIKM